MKAVRLLGPNDFTVENIPVPEISEDEILLRMKTTAICGTDMRILTGKKTRGVRYPSTIGHEICGVIEKVGAHVEGFAPGQKIAVANVIPCHHCAMCLTGHENACMNRKAIAYEFDGGFAEYVRIPEICIASGNVVPLPDDVSFAEGALIEPLSCCLHGQKTMGVKVNDVVLVEGAGPIGLMHLALAKIAGARTVIVSEPNAFRRGKAEELGADIVVNPMEEALHTVVMEASNGLGADVVVLAIGVPALVNEAFRLAKRNGSVSLFAGFPEKSTCTIDPNLIHYSEIHVTGSTAYTRQDYMEAAELVRSRRIELEKLVTHRFHIEEFDKAYEVSKSGEGLKICIVP